MLPPAYILLFRCNFPIEVRYTIPFLITFSQTFEVENNNNECENDECNQSNFKSNKTDNKNVSKVMSFLEDFKSTVKLLVNPHQLLLATLSFHSGSSLAFTSGEITRAYVCCVFGVKQVS